MIAPPKPSAHDELEALIKEARERQLRRRLLGAAGAAIAAAVGLIVYAAFTDNVSRSTSAGQRKSAPAVAGCRMPRLAVKALPMSNPTGLARLLLQLTNKRSRPCALVGFPVLRFYDRHGLIPFRYDRDGVVKAVVVEPHRSAYAVFSKFRCDLGFTRSATRGTIGLPGDPRLTASLRGGPGICKSGIPAEGRTVLVYPFEPTQRLAYETSLAQS